MTLDRQMVRLLLAAGLALLVPGVLLSTQVGLSQAAPSVVSASVDGTNLSITFSEELTSGGSLSPSEFTVSLGEETIATSSVRVNGTDLKLTLAESAPDVDCIDGSISVSYQHLSTPLTGVGGGTIDSFSDLMVSNSTDHPPEIVTIETDPTGRYIFVTFCEPIADLSYQWTDFSAFSISVDGNTRPVDDLIRRAGTPARLDIKLSSRHAINEGEAVTLAYDQSAGSEDYPLQDLDQGRHLVPSWEPRQVANKIDGPPTLQAASSIYEVVTLTFSEPLDEQSVPDPGAFSIGGLQNTPQVNQVSINNDTVLLTLGNILHNRDSPTYTLAYAEPHDSPLRQRDGLHNVADISSFQFQSSTPDARPMVSEVEADQTELRITFDLPLKAVAPASAFTISGDDEINVVASSFNGTVVTLTLSPAVGPGSIISVSYSVPNAPPRIVGRNSRDADGFVASSVTNLTTAPTPEFVEASISVDGAELFIKFTIALDASSAGLPSPSLFSLDGTAASVSTVSVDGSIVTLGLSPPGDVDEVITLSYTPPTDALDSKLQSSVHGIPVDSLSERIVTNNADGKPRVVSATVDGDNIEILFDRTLDDESHPAATAFAIEESTSSVTHVVIADQRVTLTITPAVTHLDTITLGYTQPTAMPLKRAGSSLLVESFSGRSLDNIAADPTPSFDSASVDATGRTLTIVMSQPLLQHAGGIPGMSAFTVTGTTLARIESVEVAGSRVNLMLQPAADLGESLNIDYQPPADTALPGLQSLDGKWRASGWLNESATNLADGVPRLLSATANADSLVLFFDRELNSSLVPPSSDFSVAPASSSVSLVDVDGASVTLTLSVPLAYGDDVSLSYSATGSMKLTRVDPVLTVDAFNGIRVDNQTPEPLLRSIIGNELSVIVAFSEALDSQSTPDASAFSLSATHPEIVGLTVDDMTVSLTLERPLDEGVAYTLTYTAPTESWLTTSGGSRVPAFSELITNVTDVAPRALSATGDGSIVTIAFDQPIDPGAVVVPDSFNLSTDQHVDIASVGHSDNLLMLTLTRALYEDEAGSIAYISPTLNGIGDLNGNRTDSFLLAIDNQTDTPPAPVYAAVEGRTITMVLNQELFADPRFAGTDGYPTDHFSLSGTDAEIEFILVSNEGQGGVGRIEFTLSRQIDEEEIFSITYFPGSGTIRIRDDDVGQHRAQINDYPVENLNDQPAVAISASLDAEMLQLTFDQPIKADATTPAASFTLTPDGPSVVSISLLGSMLTLTLDASVVEGKDYLLAYVPPTTGGLADQTGNLTAAFSISADNITDYAPFPVRLHTDQDAKFVFVSFDQRLQPAQYIDASLFVMEPAVSWHSAIIDSDDMEGARVKLILERPGGIREAEALRLSYQQSEAGGLQDDDADNPVSSFSEAVENLVDVAPNVVSVTVNRHVLTVEFDQDLSRDHVPPASCEQLPNQTDRDRCHADPEISWFVVIRDATERLAVDSIEVNGAIATIELTELVGREDTIWVSYSRESLQDGRFNLRDISVPANLVETFDPVPATNLTAATALGAVLDRENPDQIQVQFDGELSSSSAQNSFLISVRVDGVSAEVESAHLTGSELSLLISEQVPECSSVELSYVPDDSPILDIDGREVVAFSFDVANMIDRDWGLRCVSSDLGALLLTFANPEGLDLPGFSWFLTVNEEQQSLEASAIADVVYLRPNKSICAGDLALVQYASEGSDERLLLNRAVRSAAPCAVSALADGVRLSLTFDDQLDITSPTLSDFDVSGRSALVAIERVSEDRLILSLSPPGVHEGEAPMLSYSGTSLSGRDLTIGPFALPIQDITAPPEVVSAYAVGSSVFLTFDQPLISRTVPATRFILAGPGIDGNVKSVSLSGSSVYLELFESLPDDPDLFGLVYLARDRGGLAGATGSRVGDSVFLVRNLTETEPTVLSALAESREVVLTFDQEVEANGALATDFSVIAGRRPILVRSLSWSPERVTLTLDERITSLDAVAVRYEPSEDGVIRDSSDLPLAAFQLWANNRTSKPTTILKRVDDAKLRASAGETTVERELARGLASDDGIRVSVNADEGRRTAIRGGLMVSLHVGRLAGNLMRIQVAPIDHLRTLLEHLPSVPSSCWNGGESHESSAWWIGVNDLHGVPSDQSILVSLVGASAGLQASSVCALDLQTGKWSFQQVDGRIAGPALLLIRETPPMISWDQPPRVR